MKKYRITILYEGKLHEEDLYFFASSLHEVRNLVRKSLQENLFFGAKILKIKQIT